MGAGIVSSPAFTHALDTARESYGAALRPLLGQRLMTDADADRCLAGFDDGFRAGWQLALLEAERKLEPLERAVDTFEVVHVGSAGCGVPGHSMRCDCLDDGGPAVAGDDEDDAYELAPTVDDAPSDGEE